MKPADGIGTLLALGAALGLGSLGSRLAGTVEDPIPSVTHAFEVSSGKFAKAPFYRSVAHVQIAVHPDSDSVLWVNIMPPRVGSGMLVDGGLPDLVHIP